MYISLIGKDPFEMELAPDPMIRDYKLPFLKLYRIFQLQNWPKKINLNIEVANIVFLEKSKLKVTSRIVLSRKTNREKNLFR